LPTFVCLKVEESQQNPSRANGTLASIPLVSKLCLGQNQNPLCNHLPLGGIRSLFLGRGWFAESQYGEAPIFRIWPRQYWIKWDCVHCSQHMSPMDIPRIRPFFFRLHGHQTVCISWKQMETICLNKIYICIYIYIHIMCLYVCDI
jgi:hypothetical protein